MRKPILMTVPTIIIWASLPILIEMLSRIFFGDFLRQYQNIDTFHFWGVRVITYLVIFYITKALFSILSVFNHYRLKVRAGKDGENINKSLDDINIEIELKQDEDWEN